MARLYNSWYDGDDASKDLPNPISIRMAAQNFPLSAGLKIVLAHFSGLKSWRLVRPPLVALDDGQMIQLVKLLEAAGHKLPQLD